MKIKCPRCGKKYSVDDVSAGQWVKCADCGEEFQAHAMPEKNAMLKRVFRFSLIPVLLLILLGVIVGKKYKGDKEQRKLRYVREHVEERIKKNFKYPESAEYVYTTERKSPTEENQFIFDGYVLAPNAFGVKTRYDFSVKIDMGVFDKETHDFYYDYFILKQHQ